MPCTLLGRSSLPAQSCSNFSIPFCFKVLRMVNLACGFIISTTVALGWGMRKFPGMRNGKLKNKPAPDSRAPWRRSLSRSQQALQQASFRQHRQRDPCSAKVGEAMQAGTGAMNRRDLWDYNATECGSQSALEF